MAELIEKSKAETAEKERPGSNEVIAASAAGAVVGTLTPLGISAILPSSSLLAAAVVAAPIAPVILAVVGALAGGWLGKTLEAESSD